jgi:hypothetical protein
MSWENLILKISSNHTAKLLTTLYKPGSHTKQKVVLVTVTKHVTTVTYPKQKVIMDPRCTALGVKAKI